MNKRELRQLILKSLIGGLIAGIVSASFWALIDYLYETPPSLRDYFYSVVQFFITMTIVFFVLLRLSVLNKKLDIEE